MKADGPGALIFLRILVGAVFLSEGIQKFLYPDELGGGRFEDVPVPAPYFFGYLDGLAETVLGLMILVGLLTRVAAIPLLVDISLAIVLTKIPIMWGASGLSPQLRGFWDMAHEARADWSMLLGLIALILLGPGRISLDAWLARQARRRRVREVPAPEAS
ncbi:DoxX family protein [Rhodococcus sp. WMMA185]|uniref:DoxX family protein n=1 Tax=Rhodococcus sp. WMMA185 TaxID=679318 RepID=UPI000878458A|nr:DoxX family protein [Rhodococcus sp. WMMA185]AOW94275.1 DoxX family protein [Rhodococcus sp. WMMA185]